MKALRETQLYYAQMQVVIEQSQERILFRLEGVDSHARLLERIATELWQRRQQQQQQNRRADVDIVRDLCGCLISIGDTAKAPFPWAIDRTFRIASAQDYERQFLRLLFAIPPSPLEHDGTSRSVTGLTSHVLRVDDAGQGGC